MVLVRGAVLNLEVNHGPGISFRAVDGGADREHWARNAYLAIRASTDASTQSHLTRQVRYQACVSTRTFMLALGSPEAREPFFRDLLGPMCLNR